MANPAPENAEVKKNEDAKKLARKVYDSRYNQKVRYMSSFTVYSPPFDSGQLGKDT